jgi:hypothetical protein
MLRMQLRLPEMITGWRVSEWRITGHVVHVKPTGDEREIYDLGVQFHYYEPAGSTAALALADLGLPAHPSQLNSAEDGHEIRPGGRWRAHDVLPH